MSNHNEISSFIWRVCDDELRGLFKPHEYGDVIIPFVVLRRLDCLLEPHKDEVVELYNSLKDEIEDVSPIIKKKTGLTFHNHSRYDLQRLKSDPNGLKINFPNYINGFSDNVYQILENFLYADVHSGDKGGFFIAMSDTTRFSVDYGALNLDCEISPVYYSETIGRFAVASGDSFVTSYASRIEEGYADMDISGWLSGPLDFLRLDRMKEPKFRGASHVLALNGRYYALFGMEGGEFGRLGRIFDNGNQVIVNTNDCQFDIAKNTVSIIKSVYHKIDALLLGYVAASSWPHCYNFSEVELKDPRGVYENMGFIRRS